MPDLKGKRSGAQHQFFHFTESLPPAYGADLSDMNSADSRETGTESESESESETDSEIEFTLAEILEMGNIFRETGRESLNHGFCQKLATTFSQSRSCSGKPAIRWEQVQNWFQDKQEESDAKRASSSSGLKVTHKFDDPIIPDDEPKSFEMFSDFPSGKQGLDFTELSFEAKSAKDNAWYDVATFLTYRVLSSGELEVRVRFAGFNKDHDEWVNVRRAVRERSIPLEPSECHTVKVGDLVLCYQVREDHALYRDAHVVDIQRRLHDIKGCRCIFLVRYDYDFSEEKVPLSKLCCRPS